MNSPANTLIPLLQVLYRLKEGHVPYALTISLSPLLIDQLNDPAMPAAFNTFLDEQIAAAHHDHDFFKHGRLATSSTGSRDRRPASGLSG